MSGKSTKEYTFVLERKAKSSGGDKYNCQDVENFSVYFPQEISRDENGKPKTSLKIKIL